MAGMLQACTGVARRGCCTAARNGGEFGEGRARATNAAGATVWPNVRSD